MTSPLLDGRMDQVRGCPGVLFNSIEFLLFLPAVLATYYLCPRRWQNALLLVASYIFYGFWDARFLILIAASTLVDYAVGLGLARSDAPRIRRWLLAASLTTNLGLLGTFKYFDFFSRSLVELAARVNVELSSPTLEIVLPVGISFYTFQTLSYTIDVYRRRIEATRDPIAFAAFVAFFPQLVAGPIERAARLLPQFSAERRLDAETLAEGGRLILWGFLLKLVVADNLAAVVDAGYGSNATGAATLVGTYAFAFQIYGDFAGYSTIARGCAKLMGFELCQNFRSPYLATSVADFWQRWHISLSTWFRDYVYIPLGGNRHGGPRRLVNVLVTFVVSGFWHGAHVRFLVWGALHGAGYLPTLALRGRLPPARLARVLEWLATFHFVLFGWVWFRAEDTSAAVSALGRMLTDLHSADFSATAWTRVAALGGGLLLLEALTRQHEIPLDAVGPRRAFRLAVSVATGLLILLLGNLDNVPFIYFQF